MGRNYFTCALSPNILISNLVPDNPETLTKIFCQPFQILFFLTFFLLYFVSLFTHYSGNDSLLKYVPLVSPSSPVLFPFLRLPFCRVHRLAGTHFPLLYFTVLFAQFHSTLDFKLHWVIIFFHCQLTQSGTTQESVNEGLSTLSYSMGVCGGTVFLLKINFFL